MKIQKAEYTHIGDRPTNEDACICQILSDQAVYAVVADGLGGHGEGDKASKIAVKHLAQCRLQQTLPTGQQIMQWMRESNEEIFALRKSASQMKTTAVFLSVVRGQAIWAHIGDSRFYHFWNGRLADFSLDHSVPQMLVNAGELTREQIPSSPDRNKILRALGNNDLEPEIRGPVVLQPGRHVFLLCTDGFWEYLDDSEIWADLMKSATPDKWLLYLRCRGEMRKCGDADNNTAVAIYIDI